MKKAKIKTGISVPGFGGLNRFALHEDGWQEGTICEVIREQGNRLTIKWGDGERQNRDVYRNEIEFI